MCMSWLVLLVDDMSAEQIYEAYPDDRTKQTAAFFHEVCLLTARLVAMWQCVGFCHG